jgi:Flp pilus assembly protein protease CpaA
MASSCSLREAAKGRDRAALQARHAEGANTVFWQISQSGPWLPWWISIVASSVAAASDLHSRRIYNWLTGPVFVGGLAWSLVVKGPQGGIESLGASLLLAAPFVLLFLFAGGGAGDAKLMAALGSWLGLSNCVPVLFCVVICGALLGIGCALATGQAGGVLRNLFLMLGSLVYVIAGHHGWRHAARAMPVPVARLTIPYAVAIFAGVCVAAATVGFWTRGAMGGV